MRDFRRLWPVVVALTIAAVFTAERCDAVEIAPSDERGIRRFDGVPPILLDFVAIKAGTEDRTVLEFDVSGLAATPRQTLLILPIRDIDEGGPVGTIDVFTFVGDGVVAPSDFFAGDFYQQVIDNEFMAYLEIDVTAAVQNTLAVGGRFLGFRLSTTSSDRYDRDSSAHLPDPVLLAAVPEPPVAALFVFGLSTLVLIGRQGRVRQRRSNTTMAS